jgi:hypothetical protein
LFSRVNSGLLKLTKYWAVKAVLVYLYHEKRIALVNNFVCLVPLKNIVQGRKGYLKVEKKNPWESSFPLFYPSKAGMWKRTFPGKSLFHLRISFSSMGQYFSAGVGKQKCSPETREILFS